jgi:hypothetical protein
MAAFIPGGPPNLEVADCATGDSPQEMETANARLIAAAPDLLETAKMALLVIDGLSTEHVSSSPAFIVLNQLRFAIWKAEGGTP